MKHKNLFFQVVLLSLLFLGSMSAQNNTTAAGGDASGSGGSSSYSVGQIFYTAIESADGSINQGVQQPFEFYVLGVDEHPTISLEMSLFPNPTQGNPTLMVLNIDEPLKFQLYDLHGRQLHQDTITREQTSIPMESLATAVYYLHITNASSHVKSFKIIKH